MNFRVFSCEADLHAGVGEAVDRATASSLSPYIGIVGALPEWLRDQFTHMAKRPHLAGDPSPVRRAIERDDALLVAQERDLIEPLDLVIIVGPPPASEPRWMNDARMTYVAIDDRHDLESWTNSGSTLGMAWFFVIEEHWRAVAEPIGRKEPL